MSTASNRVIVFDTTLRDGEQSPGAALTVNEKLEIAHALEELGVDVIEAGFPISSPGDFRAVEHISREIRECVICGLTRANAKDIEVSIPKQDPSEQGHKVKSGKLTFFNEIKGYGFINESGTGQSIFVHINDFQDEINKGDSVSFEIGKGQRGPSAFNVRLLK